MPATTATAATLLNCSLRETGTEAGGAPSLSTT